MFARRVLLQLVLLSTLLLLAKAVPTEDDRMSFYKLDKFRETVDIKVDSGSGNYVIAGSSGSGVGAVASYTPDGKERFFTEFGQNNRKLEVASTAVDIDSKTGDIYVVGYTFAPIGSAKKTEDEFADFFTCKFAPDGKLVWANIWGSGQDDLAIGVVTDAANQFVYVTGTLGGRMNDARPQGMDMALFKMKMSDGSILWQKNYGGPGHEFGWSVTMGKTADDIYITGFINAIQGFLVRYDSTGKDIWNFTMRDASAFTSVLYDTKTDFIYATGYSVTFSGINTFLTRFTPDGKKDNWELLWGSDDIDYGYDLAIHPDSGDIYVVGTTKGKFGKNGADPKGGFDVTMSRIVGKDVVWTYQTGTRRDDIASAVIIDKQGRVAMCGLWDSDYGFLQVFNGAAKNPSVPAGTDDDSNSPKSGGGSIAMPLFLVFGALAGCAGFIYYKRGSAPFENVFGRSIRFPWSTGYIRVEDVYDIEPNDANSARLFAATPSSQA